MARVAHAQDDLFSPVGTELFQSATPEAVIETPDPLAELRALLALVQGADRLPWDGAWAAMEQEQRALGLARAAGAEGEKLLSAVFVETERLLAATD